MASSLIPTSLLLVFTLGACSGGAEAPPQILGEPAAPAAPAPETPAPETPPAPPSTPEAGDEWVTTAELDFGPAGSTLRRTDPEVLPRADIERQLVVPGLDGPQIFPMNEGGYTEDDGPCTMMTMNTESIFVADIDSDGENELFVAWTWSTGAGHDGAVDNLQVCGWRWTGSELVYLSELSGDLSTLGLREADAVAAYSKRVAEAGQEWKTITPQERPTDDPRTRIYDMGELSLTMRQTGAYFVEIKVSSEPSTQTRMLEGLDYFDLDNAAQRTWDFHDSWELRTVRGEPDCCAFDLAPEAEGAPEITHAWTQAGSTYVVLRQTQSEVEHECSVLRVLGGSISTAGYECEAFLTGRGVQAATTP